MIESIRWKLAYWLGDVLLRPYGSRDWTQTKRWKLVEWVFPYVPDTY